LVLARTRIRQLAVEIEAIEKDDLVELSLVHRSVKHRLNKIESTFSGP